MNYKITWLGFCMFSQTICSMELATRKDQDIAIDFAVSDSKSVSLETQMQAVLRINRGKYLDGRDVQVNKAILLLASAADKKNKRDDEKIKLQAAQLKQQERERKQDRRYACCFNCLTLAASLASTGVAIWAAVLSNSKQKTA